MNVMKKTMGDSKTGVNFDNLKNFKSTIFFQELSHVSTNIQESQIIPFYNFVFSSFEKKDSPRIDRSILVVLRQILSNTNFKVQFFSNKFQYHLPFGKKKFADGLFNICYDFAVSFPQAYDQVFTKQFSTLVPENPKKALIVISLYAQHFQNIDNPWPMLDILLQQASNFLNPSISSDYAKLLSYLCTSYSDYRKRRANHCWLQLCELLHLDFKPTLLPVYDSLISILYLMDKETSNHKSHHSHIHHHLSVQNSQSNQNTEEQSQLNILTPPPFECIEKHLQDPDLVELALRFIQQSRSRFWISNINNTHIPQALLKASIKSEHAALFLTKLCCDSHVGEQSSNALLVNTKWLSTPLPTPLDTLRITLAIFRHLKLRETIADSPEWLSFLTMVTKLKNPGTLTIVCTLLRRVKTTSERVMKMSSSGFLNIFFKIAQELGDLVSLNALLLIASTIGKEYYVPELLSICPTIALCVKKKESLINLACAVAADLSKHEKILKNLVALGFKSFFQKNVNDPRFSKSAKRFLDNAQHFKK